MVSQSDSAGGNFTTRQVAWFLVKLSSSLANVCSAIEIFGKANAVVVVYA